MNGFAELKGLNREGARQMTTIRTVFAFAMILALVPNALPGYKKAGIRHLAGLNLPSPP
jgi:hypothetical protein